MNTIEAAAWLDSRDNFLVLTHKRPDGDTLGCAGALCATLRALGKTACALPALDAIPTLGCYLEPYLAPSDFRPDFVISVDVASTSLFPDNAGPWVKRGVDLAIDHHPTNEGYAGESCVESDKAACGEIVYDIAVRLLGDTILPQEVALPLYLAVSTDTGCFVYINTTANTHWVAASLLQSGIDFAAVNRVQFRTKSFTRLMLESLLTATMELSDDGSIAVACISLDLLESIQATESDTDNISSFAGQIEGVETSVTLREYPDHLIRVSIRTVGGLDAARVCSLLGGGGHAGAAGATLKGTMDEAKRVVLEAIAQVQHGG